MQEFDQTGGAKPHVLTFIPNPVQKQFIESRAIADLFSSRMGEGKSAALCWACFYHTRLNPGARWALIRDTFENMQATTMKEFFKWFPPGIMGTYNASRKTFTWASGVAEGEVTFLGMDDQQDSTKLMSRELAGFGMDEPAPAVDRGGIDQMVFDMAMSRLRQPGMKWYSAKLAENNPDEAHWTYRKFADPGTPGFQLWQPNLPENAKNLRGDYYANLRTFWASRPDLIRRFVDGKFGFQQVGKSVTPQWSDEFHLALGLAPLPRQPVHIGWDFGLNPTAVLTQITPLGSWLILDCLVGEDIGAEELIDQAVKPLLKQRYAKCPLHHVGDPAGMQKEQSSSERSAVRVIKQKLGGTWRNGPLRPHERIEPLRAVLTKQGVVKVDRERAAAIWHALRGGWHYHTSRTGVTGDKPVKDIHSHPGDAISYLAAVLFPMGRLPASERRGNYNPTQAQYFGTVAGGFPTLPPAAPPATLG